MFTLAVFRVEKTRDYGGEAKRLLQDLQTRNERMFLVTILIMNTSNSRQKLENNIFQTASIAQKYNCALKRLDFQQEAGLMSSLPIGINQIEIQRGLTTSSTAVFVPFTTQEIFQRGEALYSPKLLISPPASLTTLPTAMPEKV